MAAASVVVTGCVTVSQSPPAKPPARPVRPASESPGLLLRQRPTGRTVTTSAPAASGLPGKAPAPGAPEPDRPAPPMPHDRVRRGHDPAGHPGGRPAARPAAPDARETVPAGVRHLGHPDVCALGQQYGRWAPGSAASLICRQTYGR